MSIKNPTGKPMMAKVQSHQQLKTFFDEWCALYGIGQEAADWLRSEDVTTADRLLAMKIEDVFATPFNIPYKQRCILRGGLLQFKTDKPRALLQLDRVNKKPPLPNPTKRLDHSSSSPAVLSTNDNPPSRKVSTISIQPQSSSADIKPSNPNPPSDGAPPITESRALSRAATGSRAGGSTSADVGSMMSSRSTSLGDMSFTASSESSVTDLRTVSQIQKLKKQYIRANVGSKPTKLGSKRHAVCSDS